MWCCISGRGPQSLIFYRKSAKTGIFCGLFCKIEGRTFTFQHLSRNPTTYFPIAVFGGWAALLPERKALTVFANLDAVAVSATTIDCNWLTSLMCRMTPWQPRVTRGPHEFCWRLWSKYLETPNPHLLGWSFSGKAEWHALCAILLLPFVGTFFEHVVDKFKCLLIQPTDPAKPLDLEKTLVTADRKYISVVREQERYPRETDGYHLGHILHKMSRAESS